MSDRSDDLFGFDEESAASAAQAVPAEEQGDMAEEVENTTSVTKCPACGANMVYDSESGKLYCEHCGTTTDIDSKSAEEQDFERLMREDNSWGAETHVFRCENCGAREVLGKGEIVKTCPFCGTSNIVATDELPGIRPNAVVPFAVGSEQAGGFARAWLKKRLFAPRKFRKSAKPEEMRGVYIPAFTFDANTDSSYSATLGVYRYRSVRRNGRWERERYTEYFHVSGQYASSFDDVLIQASSEVRQQVVNKLQPYNTRSSRAYTQEYLSGFTAEQNARAGTECWEDAKNVIANRLRSQILSGYHYDVVSSFNISTRYSDVTYKYVLLPVYVGHSTWRQKLYNFFVNGETGKVTGKAPVSPLKVLGVVLLCAAAVALLVWLGVMYAGG